MIAKRAIGLLWLGWSILTLTILSCGYYNQALEVTRTIPQTAIVTQVVERIITTTPQPSSAGQPAKFGIIGGKLCYPSEGIPPMTIYARNVDTHATYSIHVEKGASDYEIQIPMEGRYIVFAWTDAGAFTQDSRGGTFSCAGAFHGQMTYLGKNGVNLKCADREDHAPIVISVKLGETTSDAYVCDFYSEESVPKP